MAVKKSAAVQALGEVIRSARREQGYTPEGFAAHLGLDRAYYGAIERGEHNVAVDTLLKITDGLEMRASMLLRRAQL